MHFYMHSLFLFGGVNKMSDVLSADDIKNGGGGYYDDDYFD